MQYQSGQTVNVIVRERGVAPRFPTVREGAHREIILSLLLYLMLCAFWGLVVTVALNSALS